MSQTQILALPLHSGDQMPIVGFGTWKLPNQVAQQQVYTAIKNGCRLIDCAACYGNQVQVGKGINRAIKQGIVTRKDIFVTSKLWNTDHKPEHVRPAFQKTLGDLNLQYLDLYLIHWPIALKYIPHNVCYPTSFTYQPIGQNGPQVIVQKVPLIDTYRQMQKLVDQKLVRNIGVSNFTIPILRQILYQSRIAPAVNQVQLHPFLNQKKLVKFCKQNKIQITSYSTMGGASYIQLGMCNKEQLIIETDVIKNLSKKHSRTPAQIIFKWAVQQGIAIIPKTSKAERIKQNLDVAGWMLSKQQLLQIDGLNKNKRYCDPLNFLGQELSKQVLIWE